MFFFARATFKIQDLNFEHATEFDSTCLSACFVAIFATILLSRLPAMQNDLRATKIRRKEGRRLARSFIRWNWFLFSQIYRVCIRSCKVLGYSVQVFVQWQYTYIVYQSQCARFIDVIARLSSIDGFRLNAPNIADKILRVSCQNRSKKRRYLMICSGKIWQQIFLLSCWSMRDHIT